MASNWPARIAGGAAGLANGLFGGGGGMVFLPILSRFGTLEQRRLYATCVGVIFPVCAVSAAVYLWRGEIELMTALPYLIGGLIGGWLGGRLYGKISVKLLKWMFAAFLFYAGVRYLLCAPLFFPFSADWAPPLSPHGALAAGRCFCW